MAIIKPKKSAVVKKGTLFSYNPATFKQEHKISNFYDTDRATDAFRLIKPFEFMGRKFLFLDTEGYATSIKNHDMPGKVVRRWIGSGKTAAPVDIPFCMSICDGTNAVTLHSDIDTRYAEMRKLAEWLEDPTIEKVWHNAKFDMHMLANIGIKMKGKIHDTVVITKLVNENRNSFKLMDVVNQEKGIIKFEHMVDAYKKSHKIANYKHIPRELINEYANADVWNLFNVFVDEYPILIDQELESLYENELKDMMALWVMERIGMASNPEYEAPLKAELQEAADLAEQAIYDEAGGEFNINSGPQLYRVLMKLGVDSRLIAMSDKGNPVLDKKALENLADNHGVTLVQKILNFRQAEKLLTTYAVGIYGQRDSDNKVHSSINQTEATTGRMSITKPALQTLPKKNKSIRRIFLPAPGYSLWFMDLDQIEYRLFAHYAKAQGLIDAIKRGWDVHQATAAIIYNVPYEEVTEDQRTRAKTVNFSLVYGQGDAASAASLKMSRTEARAFKDKYFGNIPEAMPFIDSVQRVTKTRGYIKNLYNRRRRLSHDECYKAPNALIQGCAADYIKHKLALIFSFLMAHKYKTRMVNIVHDELIIEVHDTERFLVPKLRWLLSDFETFRVPITAGVEYGEPSWGDKKEPTEDVGFEPLTEEEMKRTQEYDVFDGSVFDLVA